MNWIWLLISILIVSCSHVDNKAGLPDLQAQQEKTLVEFERANKLLDDDKSEEAAKVYDRLIVTNPVNQLDLLITFNSGVAHLQAHNCEVAAERLRKVIRQAAKQSPPLRGRAMLRMGDVYTCLGEDDKAIANMVELYRGRFNLPVEIVKAEIPAKLAAAYARIGNSKEAAAYFKAAEQGLIQVQMSFQDSIQRLNTLSKALYLMGNIAQLNTETMTSDDYFTTIRALQKYLIKSVELNDKQWSPLASQQIEQAYNNVWDYVDQVPISAHEDAAISMRSRQIEQLRVAQTALDGIRALYGERIPDPQEPRVMSVLIDQMKEKETKLHNYISTHIVGTSLTEEGLAAESLKREGHVLNPNPVLEQKAIKKNKK